MENDSDGFQGQCNFYLDFHEEKHSNYVGAVGNNRVKW